jgi:hypothetical protein
VLVRSVSPEAARSQVESRGHVVIGVEPGVPPKTSGNRQLIICPVCSYSLRGLPPNSSGYVQCPECGAVPTDDTPLGIRQLHPISPTHPAGCFRFFVLILLGPIAVMMVLYLIRIYF